MVMVIEVTWLNVYFVQEVNFNVEKYIALNFFSFSKMNVILTQEIFFFSSLTLEGVRRALEKDLGLEMYSLDAHKKFIKQCVDKVSSVVYGAIIKVLRWFFYTYNFPYSLVGFPFF